MKTLPLTAGIVAVAIAISVGIGVWHLLRSAGEAQKTVLDCSGTRVLDRFDDDLACEALLRHLCASAAWRVTGDSGVIKAEKRGLRPRTDADWSAWHKDPTHLSITLHFDASRARAPSARWDDFSVAQPGASAVEVALFRARDASAPLGSLVLVNGKRLILEILEFNASPDRVLTRNAIEEVSAELSAIRNDLDVVVRDGYLRRCLPEKSIRQSVEDVPIDISDEGMPSGLFWVSGYANTGEKGYVTIRTFDASTGEELGVAYNQWTVEYVGWSPKPHEKFFFESEVIVAGDGTKKNVRFEVWFHADGKKDRKLLETTRAVPTWTR